jgi:radical SAM protein with 4Fe4S-binding SPASM domain
MREEAFMSIKGFEDVLKKIKGHGHYVYLHLKGEPLTHGQIKEILTLCEAYDLKVNLTTNGTLLEEKQSILLESKALRQVSISLQSFEDIEDIDSYKTYLNQVIGFVKEGLSGGTVIFELRLWNLKEETLSSEGVIKNPVALKMIKGAFNLDENLIEGLPQGKGIKLTNRLYLSQSHQFQWPDLKLESLGDKGTCYGLRQQVGILVNGDVVPCCLDSEGDMVLGNIFEESFEAIVTNERATKIIEGFENQRLSEDLCQRCGYRERFN